jgi:hypothetical protein
MEFSGQAGTDDRCISACIKKKLVGAGVVDHNREDNLVAVYKAER